MSETEPAPSAHSATPATSKRLAAEAVGQRAPDQRSEDGADAGTQQHDRGLAEGQVPLRRQHRDQEADDEIVEIIEDEIVMASAILTQ